MNDLMIQYRKKFYIGKANSNLGYFKKQDPEKVSVFLDLSNQLTEFAHGLIILILAKIRLFNIN